MKCRENCICSENERMAKFPDGFIKIWEVKWQARCSLTSCVLSSTHLQQFNKHFGRAINNGKWTIQTGHSDISPVGIFQWETLKCSSGGRVAQEPGGLGAASEFAMNRGESEHWPLLFSLPEFNTLTQHRTRHRMRGWIVQITSRMTVVTSGINW